MQNNNVGIVLAGGGGKGAYEIGAWIALQDIIRKCNLNVVAFSGTSVGALNAALFSCNSAQEAKRIWDTVNFEKVLTPKAKQYLVQFLQKKTLKELIKFGFFGKEFFLYNTIINGAITNIDIINILKNGIFSRDGIIDIIQNANIRESIQNQNVFASCFDISRRKSDYIRLSKENYLDTLLASSALPGIFGIQNINEDLKYYWDGGMGDNLPISPLVDNRNNISIDKYIVLHLDNKYKFKNSNLAGCKIYHIFPSEDIRGALGRLGTLDFSKKGISRREAIGIKDVTSEMNHIYEIQEFFKSSNNIEGHLLRGKEYSSIEQLYEHAKYGDKIKDAKHLKMPIENESDLIEIEANSNLDEAVTTICTLKERDYIKVLKVLSAVLPILLIAGVTFPPAAMSLTAPLIPIIGLSTIKALIVLISSMGSVEIIKIIRDKYHYYEMENGNKLLVSKKKEKEMQAEIDDFLEELV